MESNAARESGVFGTEVSQFLTFLLGQEQYGIEILKVQEIKGYTAPTPIPNAPTHVRGVMNLRGTVVPVVDLRSRFGMQAVESNQFTVVIVVTVGSKVFGLVVDAVSDVLDIATNDIEPRPDLGTGTDITFLKGMAKTTDRLIALLDIDEVLSNEAGMVESTAAA
jgi:purine-binding chemotaxis protein CheW